MVGELSIRQQPSINHEMNKFGRSQAINNDVQTLSCTYLPNPTVEQLYVMTMLYFATGRKNEYLTGEIVLKRTAWLMGVQITDIRW